MLSSWAVRWSLFPHSFSQIVDDDCTYVLEQGCMVASGTYQTIHDQNGACRRIFDASFRSLNVEKIVCMTEVAPQSFYRGRFRLLFLLPTKIAAQKKVMFQGLHALAEASSALLYLLHTLAHLSAERGIGE